MWAENRTGPRRILVRHAGQYADPDSLYDRGDFAGREPGTFEQLLSTPLSLTEILVGKMLPYVGVGYLGLCIMLTGRYLSFELSALRQLPVPLPARPLFRPRAALHYSERG